jgi:NAD(P)-dependent dehydrogenase (short-subunit alcohol dehydrogenase family)
MISANILFAKSLADDSKNTHIRILSLDPGIIATNLLRHINFFVKFVVKNIFVHKTVPQGASTTLKLFFNFSYYVLVLIALFIAFFARSLSVKPKLFIYLLYTDVYILTLK